MRVLMIILILLFVLFAAAAALILVPGLKKTKIGNWLRLKAVGFIK